MMIVDSDPCGADRDRRLEQVLADYLQAARRGDAPNRQAILDAYPEFAADLIAFLDDPDRPRGPAESPPRPTEEMETTDEFAGAEGTEMPPALEPGRIVGDYEILGVLGWGGMGIVYEARQQSLDRRVALKMLRGGSGATAEELRRFHREAEAIARLAHPHIVPVHEIGQHEGHHYFSMDLIRGSTLAARIGRYAGDPQAAARIMVAVARAIHHAHERGILHRDLKPSNVLIDERGQPMVVDFGLAMLPSRAETLLTQVGTVPGTPAFMAPEQVDGRREGITAATDVHGLGTILYTLLTGRPPFRGATPWATLSQVRDQVPDRPRSIRPSVDRDLETICLKCLEKDATRRYASAEALADDLERWLDGRPIRARRIGPIGRSWRLARRYPRLTALATVLIAIGAAGALAIHERARLDEEARRQARALADDRSARDVAQAWRDWAENRLDSVRQLLDRQPGAAAVDRGFVWRQLDRLAHLGRPPLLGHRGPIYGAAFSPDGSILATVGQDGIIRLWDPASGTSRELSGHGDEVNSVAFSPDGRLLVTAGDDRSIRVWDVRTGRERMTLTGRGDHVVAALFTPDGRQLISATRDGTLTFRDAATGRESRTIGALAVQRVQGLSISPDGSMLAIAGKVVLVLDVSTGVELARLSAVADREMKCAVFSGDGRWLAAAGPDNRLSFWRTRDWRLVDSRSLLDGNTEGVAFAPDSRTLAAVGARGLIHLVDPVTGAWDLIATGQDRLWCLAFSPDGRTLATGSRDGSLRLWERPRDGTRIAVSIPAGTLAGVEFSADGAELTSVDIRGRVWIHDARQGRLKADLRVDAGAPIVRVALSPNGRWLAAETTAGQVRIWSLPEGRPRPMAGGRGRGDLLGLSPGGRLVATRKDKDSDLLVWNADRGRMTAYALGGSVTSVLFSPTPGVFSALLLGQGGPVLGGLPGGVLRMAGTAGHGDDVVSQAFSRDGKRLATGGNAGMIVVWDVATLEPVLELPDLTSQVNALAFAPDGRTLAAGHRDRMVSLWDVPTGRRLTSLRGHSGPVRQVRFSPDGMTLASVAAASDATTELFLWPARPPG